MAKEVDLAAQVVEWLQRQHWTVYQEVQGGGGRHDIVAVRNGVCAVVECKMVLSFHVLEQAWRAMAHFRYVAVPQTHTGRRNGRDFAYKCAAMLGIGVLETTLWSNRIKQVVRPRFVRHRRRRRSEQKLIKRYMLDTLTPERTNWGKAGSQGSLPYWTPYKETMMHVKQILLDHPGSTINEIMTLLGDDHHYRSDKGAKQCVQKALREWESAWCKIDTTEKAHKYSVREDVDKKALVRKR